MIASFIFAAFFLSSFVLAMSEFRKNIENSFDELGVSYDDVILQKCLEICQKYDINDAEEYVDTWMAYSVSHLQGENPTLTNLAKFEREEYAKKVKEIKKGPDVVHAKSLTIYEANKDMEIDEASSIMMAYNETTPRRNFSKNDGSGIKRSRSYGSSPQAAFSPASFSPTIATPSSKYVSRTNSGDVVLKFNDNNDSSRTWKTEDLYVAKIERITECMAEVYMSYDLVDWLDYANNAIEKLGDLICAKYSLENIMSVRYKHPSPFTVVGRISCDADGRLNAKSVILEGSTDGSLGESVRLDLSRVEQYSIFPGQIVGVEGYNTIGDKLIVKNIYSDVAPEPSKYQLIRGSLNVMIAAGPFTQSDSMTYQPLLDLIEEVIKSEPHALILTGPLIDSNHPVIQENTIAESFQDLFGKLIDIIMKPLEKKRTQVILVNSYKDCNANYVYPTPQISIKTKPYPKLHLLPDPSVFTLEDVIFGTTSTDIMLHLSKEEISCPQGAGRLLRLAGHVLGQRNFYPLNPASEVPIDPTLMNHAKLDVAPHVLILPSDLRYFIKEVSGCIVVNPERLAKGVIGGTFARLIINKNEVIGNIVKI